MNREVYKGYEFNEFIKIFDGVFQKLKCYPIKVLYGFNWNQGGGVFVDILMRNVFHTNFDYVIDDEVVAYGSKIYKKNLLDYLNNEETVIVSATGIRHDALTEYGYVENVNWFDVSMLYDLDIIGYFEFLEKKYSLDISGRKTAVDVRQISVDAVKYGPSRSMSLPFLVQYLAEKYSEMNVLDLGCGKGGAMITFKDFGYTKVDGIEILDELAEIACNNLIKWDKNDSSKIFCKDVLSFDKFEDYNMFYIYDSFRGDTFMKVKNLIKESVKNKPRKIVLVYANPFEHKMLVDDGYFKFVKQLEGDWLTRLVNIYENN